MGAQSFISSEIFGLKRVKYFFDFFKDARGGAVSLNMVNFMVLFKLVNNFFGLRVVCPQSFLDNFFSIIASLVFLSAVQNPFDHFFLTAPEVQNERTLTKPF